MSDVLKKLNFVSWLELYEYLREMGWHEKARIRMHPHSLEEVGGNGEPERSRNHPYEFDLVEIKANAFQEIYDTFPRSVALEVMLEVAHEAAKEVPAADILVHYLNKLKLRKV